MNCILHAVLRPVVLTALAAVCAFSLDADSRAHSEGSALANPYWPRFRGPGGLGTATSADAPTYWDRKTGVGILWDLLLDLPGESSPVIWGKRVFLTGATPNRCEVLCLDADSGKLLWRKGVKSPVPAPAAAKGGEDPKILLAAATPVVDGRMVHAIFGNGDIASFDLEGNEGWVRNLGVPENDYGHASSLEVWKDLLLVQLDQGKVEDGRSKLIALDVASGRTVWEAKREAPAAWSSPIVVSAAGRQQVIVCGDPWVTAYDPSEGREIWRARCLGGEVVPSPILAGEVVVAASVDGTLSAIRLDGKGDVTSTHVVWAVEDDLPGIASPVAASGLVFTLTTGGILACHGLKDGRRIWDRDFETSFQASPVIAGKVLYLLSDSGDMFILEAGSEYRLMSRCSFGEPCQASPALYPGRLYVRTKRHLVAVGNRPE